VSHGRPRPDASSTHQRLLGDDPRRPRALRLIADKLALTAAISPYLRRLRGRVGHDLVLLPSVAVLMWDEEGRA
jgi:hypothetical protein